MDVPCYPWIVKPVHQQTSHFVADVVWTISATKSQSYYALRYATKTNSGFHAGIRITGIFIDLIWILSMGLWSVKQDWYVVIPLLPIITINGEIVWLRPCETRLLHDVRNDGMDWRRRISVVRQYRVLSRKENPGKKRDGNVS